MSSQGPISVSVQHFSSAWEQSLLFYSFFQSWEAPCLFSILYSSSKCSHLCIYLLLNVKQPEQLEQIKEAQNGIKELYTTLPSSISLLCRLRQWTWNLNHGFPGSLVDPRASCFLVADGLLSIGQDTVVKMQKRHWKEVRRHVVRSWHSPLLFPCHPSSVLWAYDSLMTCLTRLRKANETKIMTVLIHAFRSVKTAHRLSFQGRWWLRALTPPQGGWLDTLI